MALTFWTPLLLQTPDLYLSTSAQEVVNKNEVASCKSAQEVANKSEVGLPTSAKNEPNER